MLSSHRHILLLSVVLAVVSIVLQVLSQGDLLPFRYQRDLILEGAYWRLLSGQFVHLNLAHLLMNLAAMAVTVALFWHRLNFLSLLLLWSCAVLATGWGLLIGAPDVLWYVGLSGALHGVFAGAAILAIYHGDRWAWLAAVLLLAKLVGEAFGGSPGSTEQLIEGAVVIEAHRFGSLGGALMGLGLLITRRRPVETKGVKTG